MEQTNYWAPDGYRYGVMFDDGSVADLWNGESQRERAEQYLESTAGWLATTLGRPSTDRITLARMALGEPWERVEPAHE
jgi:hypothetical protein